MAGRRGCAYCVVVVGAEKARMGVWVAGRRLNEAILPALARGEVGGGGERGE